MVHHFAGWLLAPSASRLVQASIRTLVGGVNGRAVHGGVYQAREKGGPCLLVIALIAHARRQIAVTQRRELSGKGSCCLRLRDRQCFVPAAALPQREERHRQFAGDRDDGTLLGGLAAPSGDAFTGFAQP